MTTGTDPGQIAPDFELPLASGRTLRLSSLRGRKVVLYFYPKDDTSACTAEAVDFNALRGKFARAGAAVVGISPDSPKSHAKFAAKFELKIPLASDESKATIQRYGLWVEKSLYGRKYMGVERTTFLIDSEGAIERVWRKVKVKGHAEEALATVKAGTAHLELVNPNTL